jgi:signal transduction histidine kinase
MYNQYMFELIQDWFTNNHAIVYFVYGQVFFMGGLAIIVQTRRFSRLQLAQSLPWLAAFCIIHGFNEWGDLFIPIQEQTSASPLVTLLKVMQLILLGSSYACLLMFGVDLLRPTGKLWWLRWLPMGLFVLWLEGPFWYGLISPLPLSTWENVANAIARYGLGFTGSIVCAYSLLRYSKITPILSHMPNIRRHLRIAALALIFYALFGGLIVPPAPFFPANIFNTTTFSQVFALPVLVFRGLSGLLLAIAMIRGLEIFELETDQIIEHMELNQVVASERERIGRDLHDGALQRVYAAGLQAQAIRKHMRGQRGNELDDLIGTLNSAIADLRGFLAVMRPAETNADLKNALQMVIEDSSHTADIQISFLPEQDLLLPPEKVTHLAAVVREALSNVVRHANATRVEISYTIENNILQLKIRDNGMGLPKLIDAGYGMRNMKDRMRLLGGELNLTAPLGNGTCVCLRLPLEGSLKND